MSENETKSELSTEDVLAEMLTENTGRHFLDSGGAYGRHFERNQAIDDFEAVDRAKLTFEVGTRDNDWWFELYYNLYHWLNSRVEYAPTLQKMFDVFVNATQNEVCLADVGLDSEAFNIAISDGVNSESNWFILRDAFVTYLQNLEGLDVQIEFGITNSYNHQNNLSQDIEFYHFSIETEPDCKIELDASEYILLMIHGGCDIRGGYTFPKCFKVFEEFSIFDFVRGSIYCDNPECHAIWDIDGDSIEFIAENESEGKDLNEYEYGNLGLETTGHSQTGICPICAKGKLYGDFWG